MTHVSSHISADADPVERPNSADNSVDYIQVVSDVHSTLVDGDIPFAQNGFQWFTQLPPRAVRNVSAQTVAAVREHTVIARGVISGVVQCDTEYAVAVRPPMRGEQ